jgi:hypothetical protein
MRDMPAAASPSGAVTGGIATVAMNWSGLRCSVSNLNS